MSPPRIVSLLPSATEIASALGARAEMSDLNAVTGRERCACSAPARRLCDDCEAVGATFVACSLACLGRHRGEAHRALDADSVTRARARIREDNRRAESEHETDIEHRQRLMSLIAQLPDGEALCVFAAGNADELELERLTRHFREVHLVDLDGDALTRARDRQAAAARAKIVLHEGVDASGLLEHLDAWGDRFPERAELARVATEAAQTLVHGLGATFPAVISLGALNRFALPFQRAWLASRSHWAALLSTIRAIHLATLAGAARSGGRCLLTFDVASSRELPALAEQRHRAPDELSEFVHEALGAGDLHLRPDPGTLIEQLASPGMRSLVSEPRLSEPWLRHRAAEAELVYGVIFDRP
jgi:hypothetical protein